MPAAKSSVVSKPTYAVMVTECIKALGDRTGSSTQAISKYLMAHYKTDVNKTALSRAIKKGVEAGDFVQIRASYKLGKKPVKVSKPAAKKKVTKARKATVKSTKKALAKGPRSKISKSRVSKKLEAKKAIVKKSMKKKAASKASGKKSAASAKKKSK